MQTRNDDERLVFNGDMGRIAMIVPPQKELLVRMPGKRGTVRYGWEHLDQLQHAFAVSVHKAQGSEFRAVVLPVIRQHAHMLQRNLLYTGLTRARKLAVLVGTRQAIQIAVNNDKVEHRYTGLAWRLAE